MGSVVADTHALLWSMYEPEKLSKAALAAFQDAIAAGQPVYLSAISIVEVCYLVEKGKLGPLVLDHLLSRVRARSSGLTIYALDESVATVVRHIPRDLVPVLPDRVIAATAFHLGLPLVTRDAQIRSANITTIW
jgi:PIN domain nuclease of toxin-antitoxin system